MIESSPRRARWWRWPVAFVCAFAASYLTGLLLFLLQRQTALSTIGPALIGTSVVGGLVFYFVARSVIGAVLVGVASLPATLAFVFISLFFIIPANSKYPKGPVTSIEPLTTFSEFPVYWLGRRYNGLDLTDIRAGAEPSYSPVHNGPTHTVMFLTYGYGTCSNRDFDSRCTGTPLLLIVEPACGVSRMNYQRSPDTFAWTPDVSIEVQGSAAPSKQDFLRDLSLANVSKFPDAKVVDSATYDTTFRSRCGDAAPP
jgi:hypothetical protein